mmetsp:Transcript_34683/g.56124  ORF Transcript_34683/g.56124 Transcript_34683/m.56124 type:complete len:269 (+) Transcript_34683:859-1665(+)
MGPREAYRPRRAPTVPVSRGNTPHHPRDHQSQNLSRGPTVAIYTNVVLHLPSCPHQNPPPLPPPPPPLPLRRHRSPRDRSRPPYPGRSSDPPKTHSTTTKPPSADASLNVASICSVPVAVRLQASVKRHNGDWRPIWETPHPHQQCPKIPLSLTPDTALSLSPEPFRTSATSGSASGWRTRETRVHTMRRSIYTLHRDCAPQSTHACRKTVTSPCPIPRELRYRQCRQVACPAFRKCYVTHRVSPRDRHRRVARRIGKRHPLNSARAI